MYDDCIQRSADDLLGWIEHFEVHEYLVRFASVDGVIENRNAIATAAGHYCVELHDCLVGDANGLLVQPAPQKLDYDALLTEIPWVIAVDEDIRVNDCGHGRSKGPRASSPWILSSGVLFGRQRLVSWSHRTFSSALRPTEASQR